LFCLLKQIIGRLATNADWQMADADYLNFTVSLVYFAATSEEQKHIGQATEGRQ